MSFSFKEKAFAVLAFAGIGLAVAGSIIAPKAPLSPGAVARVDGQLITRADFDAALKTYAGGRTGDLTAAERRRLLDHLIDDRLLVARAFALGLPERDARVKAAILAAMQEFIVAAVPEPDEATLRAYFSTHKDMFTPPRRYRVRALYVADSRDSVRISRVEAGLKAGMSFDALAAQEGQGWDAAPPKSALPAHLLGKWLGPSGLAALPAMKAGETLGPFAAGHGVYYLHLAELLVPEAPLFADVRAQVLVDWRRAANAKAVEAYLADLRAKADIEETGP